MAYTVVFGFLALQFYSDAHEVREFFKPNVDNLIFAGVICLSFAGLSFTVAVFYIIKGIYFDDKEYNSTLDTNEATKSI